MPTTDEELAELQRGIEEKRQRLVDARAERESNERSLANDITAAQLAAESAKLDALIADEERRGSMEVVEAATAVVLNPEASREMNEALHEMQLQAPAEAAAAAEAADPAAETTEGSGQ